MTCFPVTADLVGPFLGPTVNCLIRALVVNIFGAFEGIGNAPAFDPRHTMVIQLGTKVFLGRSLQRSVLESATPRNRVNVLFTGMKPLTLCEVT